jgi:hypothetical protein
MFNDPKRKFLFKCEDCAMILSVDFESEEDLKDIQDDKIELECPCEGKCRVLRD